MTRHWHWPTVGRLQSIKHRKRNFPHSQCKHGVGNFQHLLLAGCCNKVTSSIWNLSCEQGASYCCRCPPLRMSDFYEHLSTSCVFVCLLSAPSCPPLLSLSSFYLRTRGQTQLYEHDKCHLPGGSLPRFCSRFGF